MFDVSVALTRATPDGHIVVRVVANVEPHNERRVVRRVVRQRALRGAAHRLAPAPAFPRGAQGKAPAPPADECETLRVPRVRLQPTPMRGVVVRVFRSRAHPRDVARARQRRGKRKAVVAVAVARRFVIRLRRRLLARVSRESLAVREPRALRSASRASAPAHFRYRLDREPVPGRARSALPRRSERRGKAGVGGRRRRRRRRREAGVVEEFGALRVRTLGAPVPRAVAGGPAAQVPRETRRAEEPAGARAERFQQHVELRSGFLCRECYLRLRRAPRAERTGRAYRHRANAFEEEVKRRSRFAFGFATRETARARVPRAVACGCHPAVTLVAIV